MFGSQALEAAIAVALVLSLLSTAASAITESISRVVGKRARDLQRSIGAMLAGSGATPAEQAAAAQLLTGTAAFDAARAGSGRTLVRRRPKQPSYLSARAFADAVTQVLLTPGQSSPPPTIPDALRRNVAAILAETSGGLVELKARLEGQFDELMDRAAGAYKRWASLILGGSGLLIAVAGNVSVIAVAQEAWTSGDGSLAVGWTEQQRLALGTAAWWDVLSWPGARWAAVSGWLLTALLVMLGGPFWFDALGRLTSLRSAGARPPSAAGDPRSASAALAQAWSASRNGTGDGGPTDPAWDVPARLAAVLQGAPSPVARPGVSQPADPAQSVEDSGVIDPEPPQAAVLEEPRAQQPGPASDQPVQQQDSAQRPGDHQTHEQQAQARKERAASARLHARAQVARAQDAWTTAWAAKREARRARQQAREAEAAARRAEAEQRRAAAPPKRAARPQSRPARPYERNVRRLAGRPRRLAGALARKVIPVLDDAASRLEARLAVGRAIRAREAQRPRV